MSRVTPVAAQRLVRHGSCSVLAIAATLAFAPVAFGQAFQGTPTVQSGNVTINSAVPGQDTITVRTPQAVIDWVPADAAVGGPPINFLPAGNVALFNNDPVLQNNFTVLNRVLPADPNRPIALNGSIVAQLQQGAGVVPGGNVWFYSPGGVLVGATATIDVGGLLLTTDDLVRNPVSGDFIDGANNAVFQAGVPGSRVTIAAGASINATPENSYVALVAPVVDQSGAVNVNGSALYVGAEAATISFNTGGLFNITINQGSDGVGAGGVPVSHSGITTGPASSGAGDNHRVYLVAVPRNTAITMAIGAGSSLGFDIAAAADTVGNSIILSAGYNVAGNAIGAAPVNPGQAANITIGPASFTSAASGSASNTLTATIGSGTLSFASDAVFGGRVATSFTAANAGTIQIGGDLALSADNFGLNDGDSATGGGVTLAAIDGGTISVNGNAAFEAIGQGAGNLLGGPVGSGNGGAILLRAYNGGSLSIAGDTTVIASGFAGTSGTIGTTAAGGQGGVVTIESGRINVADSNANIAFGADLLVQAQGIGSDDFGSGVAGTGLGGQIVVRAGAQLGTVGGVNNQLTVAGTIDLQAGGFGGSGLSGAAGTGGLAVISAGAGGTLNAQTTINTSALGIGGLASGTGSGGIGQGGNARIEIYGDGGVLNAAGAVSAIASGFGGSDSGGSANGGNAIGGTAQIVAAAPGGALNLNAGALVEARGFGGDGVNSGSGLGGTAFLNVVGTSTIQITGAVTVNAAGIGGDAPGPGTTGSGTGGLAALTAVQGGAILITGTTQISADGSGAFSGGFGVDGGDGIGGNASISQNTGGYVDITGDALVTASGTGADNTGGGDGVAGIGRGGDARIAVNNAPAGGLPAIHVSGQANVQATGTGGTNQNGTGGSGGAGIGGLANLGAGIGRLQIDGAGSVVATGQGGGSVASGGGGAGTGGSALIGTVNPGAQIVIGGGASGFADGLGGVAVGGGVAGGSGTGGTAQIFAQDGTVQVTQLSQFQARGSGGIALGGADAGAGSGGFASVVALNAGTLNFNGDVNVISDGVSNGVSSGAGAGALATGGNSIIEARQAGSALTITGTLTASADAFAGIVQTGAAGTAVGGRAFVQTQSGALTINGAVGIEANAFGGSSLTSGNGGAATGGATGYVIFGTGGGSLTVTGSALQIADGFGGSANHGTGGSGTGGTADLGTLGIAGTLSFGGDSSLEASGFGGAASLSGGGGAATGGTASVGVNLATLTGAGLSLNALGRGGSGAGGGAGGQATGGSATITAGSGATAGSVQFGNTQVSVGAQGGTGGTGQSGATGGAGGAGGNATGGTTAVFGLAGNGNLVLGDFSVNAFGAGGFGGDGGIGLAGQGGSGGAGGTGTAGFNQFGTASGPASAVNTGSADLASVVSLAIGFGGDGGDGGTGSTGAGNGGNGGAGFGGQSTLLVRGSRVTVGDVIMDASGFGGNGGNGAVQGNGGNADSGFVAVLATERFQQANRGVLQAGNITGAANAFAGTGAVAGTALFAGSPQLTIRNSDATATSIDLSVGPATPDGTNTPDAIAVVNGTLGVGGALSVRTPGEISFTVDNGQLQAGSVLVSAGNFVPDSVNPTTNPGPVTADTVDLQSAGNLIASALFNSNTNFSANAPGQITLGAIGGPGGIAVSGSAITLGNIASGDFVILNSSGPISTGTMDAATFAQLLTSNGNIATGAINAGDYVDIETLLGSVTLGNIIAGSYAEIDATGNVITGSGNTGLNFSITTPGGSISTGAITAQGVFPGDFYAIGLAAGTGTLNTGPLNGNGRIGLLSLGGGIATGALTTNADLLLLSQGAVTIGGGTTIGAGGLFYAANASLASLLGPNFDPGAVFIATPVRLPGSLTLGGAFTGGDLVAATTAGFTAQGAITATDISIDTGGTASFAGIAAAPTIGITANDIDIGANGGLGDANTGFIALFSGNPGGLVLGDNVSSPGGFRLGNAEAQRIRTNFLSISGVAGQAQPQTVTIGDLSLSGGTGANANIRSGLFIDPSASSTGLLDANSGVIRITGNFALTNATPDTLVALFANRIELAADTGSIRFTNATGELDGILSFTALDAYIASSSLLQQLVANPNFTGRDAALAVPVNPSSTNGVLAAGNFAFDIGRRLLVQNSGTPLLFAGFRTGDSGFGLNPYDPGNGPIGPLEIVIYGQLIGANGDAITNEAVRGALFANGAPSGYTANSSVNGCLLTASECLPPLPGNDNSGTVTNAVRDIGQGSDAEQREREEQKRAAEEAAREGGEPPKRPIPPPVNIVNTRRLGVEPLVSEPVTGGGNPNLIDDPKTALPGATGGQP